MGFMERYEELCRAAREGRIRYAVEAGAARFELGWEAHGEAEAWALRNVEGLFRVRPYVVPLAA